ncbi:DNA helicase [Tanacetum coccineum]
MRDDIPMKISKSTGIPNYHVNTTKLQGYILYELEAILNGFGKCLKDFGPQPPPEHLLKDLENKLLMEEKNYNRELLMQDDVLSVTMAENTTASLKIGQANYILEVKVYRKWISKSTPKKKEIGVRFTCEATITSVAKNIDWNYSSCSQCNKKSTKTNDSYTCEDHGIQDPLTYRYNFKATISHATATAYFTFFTKAGEKLTGHPCSELATKYKGIDQRQLPIEVVNIIGKK